MHGSPTLLYSMEKKVIICSCGLIILGLSLVVATDRRENEQVSKPHILVLLVDDWGWANVGYHRDPPTPEVVTPNFDSLKSQGLELDQQYAFRVCSPTRSSFLTGRLPIHVNDINLPGNHYNPQDPVSGFAGIPRNMTTIATKLKQAGYQAHSVGKWHAGMATPQHMPTGRGFSSSYGYLNGVNDYYTEHYGEGKCDGKTLPDLWETDHPANKDNGTDYEEALFKKHVLDILENHDPSVPLFLYYTPHIVHAPLEVPDNYLNKFKFINDSDRQHYHAMVNYLDDIVGNITEILKRRGLWDNLLFLVSSDNGGPVYPGGGANNYPLKGGKASNWQGGVRVNAFVTGGFLPKEMVGQKMEEYIHIADWYATFCSIVGVDPTDNEATKAKLPPIDSLNMWPLISGKNKTSPRVEMALSNDTLISGPFKIITGNANQAGWTGPQYPNTTNPKGGIKAVEHCGEGCLYNIMDDPEERVNLASKMPDKLKEMQGKLEEAMKTYFNPDRGGVSTEACDVFMNKYGGFWGPWIYLK